MSMEEKSTEDRVRDKAYELWEADGRPHGREEFHWAQAREIIAIKDSNESTFLSLEASLRDPAEPTVAFENQADLPDMADQGESQPGPSWAAAASAAELPPEPDAKPGKADKPKRASVRAGANPSVGAKARPKPVTNPK
jgi:hypothetical protein